MRLNLNKHTRVGLFLLALTTFVGCHRLTETNQRPTTQLMTRLGQDTIALEHFQMDGNEVFAKVLVRSPKTSLIKYHLVLNDSLEWQEMTEQHLYPHFSNRDSVLRQRRLSFSSDSTLVIETRSARRINNTEIPMEHAVLPFIDLVHWPYEVVVRRMERAGRNLYRQPLLSGQRVLDFEFERKSRDSLIIRHPSRGDIIAILDDQGHLTKLDALSTTRKLEVARSPVSNLNQLAGAYSSREQEGTGIGALSGRGRTESEINEVLITLDYGRPAKRGRQLFGALVPWGKVWRTGANMATHFSTDSTLLMGGELMVPPGEYTMFTIPEPDGGELILNLQTGQNGRNYDHSRNLGSVPMKIIRSTGDRELFTIEIQHKEDGGTLQLAWGTTQFEVDFEISTATPQKTED